MKFNNSAEENISLIEALDYLKAAMIEVIEIVKLIYQRHSRKCIFSYSIIMENYESEMPHPVSYEFEKSNLNSNPNNSFFRFFQIFGSKYDITDRNHS